jgi:pyruvate,water dikinase
VSWAAPLPGGWLRCIRLGEWLPEPVTPLFETWLLHEMEEAFRRCQLADGGFLPPAPLHVLVHGWYFHSPIGNGSQWRLLRGLARRPRLGTAMALAPRSPRVADRLFYGRLADRWRDRLLPRYRELAAAGERQAGPADTVGPADAGELAALVDRVAAVAGECAWTLALCGGAAWRFEEALDRCCRQAGLAAGTSQVLTSGLGTAELPGHSVHSLDWLRETLGELPADPAPSGPAALAGRREQAAARRRAAQADGERALAARRRRLARFGALTELAQRYAVLREEQSRWLTLGWPLLRRCVLRLGELARADGVIETPGQVFFLTRAELAGWLRGQPADGLARAAQARRAEWERQRRLTAPLAVGRPPALVAWLLRSAVRQGADARTEGSGPGGTVLRGTPASPGRATGPARVLRDPADAAAVRDGEILIVGATVPALTPLFGRIAGLCADSGSVAAHACLVAREYGIPAVTGLGDATARIADGALVTADGTSGYVDVRISSSG